MSKKTEEINKAIKNCKEPYIKSEIEKNKCISDSQIDIKSSTPSFNEYYSNTESK